MTEEVQPEMDTFPILRPDLIPVLSKEWLTKSQTALVPLIGSLRAEGDASAGLLGYAIRQHQLVFEELARRAAAERVAALVHGLASQSNSNHASFLAPYSVDSVVWSGQHATLPQPAYSAPVLPVAPPFAVPAPPVESSFPLVVSSASASMPAIHPTPAQSIVPQQQVHVTSKPPHHPSSARSARSEGGWKSNTSRDTASDVESSEQELESGSESDDESELDDRTPRRSFGDHSTPSHRSHGTSVDGKPRRRVKKSTVAPPASAGFVVVTANAKRRNWGNPANKRKEKEAAEHAAAEKAAADKAAKRMALQEKARQREEARLKKELEGKIAKEAAEAKKQAELVEYAKWLESTKSSVAATGALPVLPPVAVESATFVEDHVSVSSDPLIADVDAIDRPPDGEPDQIEASSVPDAAIQDSVPRCSQDSESKLADETATQLVPTEPASAAVSSDDTDSSDDGNDVEPAVEPFSLNEGLPALVIGIAHLTASDTVEAEFLRQGDCSARTARPSDAVVQSPIVESKVSDDPVESAVDRVSRILASSGVSASAMDSVHSVSEGVHSSPHGTDPDNDDRDGDSDGSKTDDVGGDDSKAASSASDDECFVDDDDHPTVEVPVARSEKTRRNGSGHRQKVSEETVQVPTRRPSVPSRPVRRRKPHTDVEYVSKYGKHFPEWKHVFSVAACELGGGVGEDAHKVAPANIKERKSHLDTAVETATNCVVEACHLLSVARTNSAGGTVPSPSPPRFYRVVQHKAEVFKIVTDCLTETDNWHLLPDPLGEKAAWNLMWTWSKPHVTREHLLTWQKINHFKHAKELVRKDLLKKNLARYQVLNSKMNAMFTLSPMTFVLPKEFLPFAEVFGKIASANVEASERGDPPVDPNFWIMKPVGLSRGRGISVVNDLSQVSYGDNVVIQKYISNPLLLDGYKFDLRLYILVTSFHPLEAFIYKEGFARLATHKFSSNVEDMKNKFIHLTNSSIQKDSDRTASTLEQVSTEVGGTKTSLTYLWRRLKEIGVDTEAVWENIIDLVIRSLVCADDVIPYQPNSFEVFGYDVLIDDTLRPWLIEVNSSPSMGTDSELDTRVKHQMISDTIKLVDPLPFNGEKLLECIAKRQQIAAEAKRRAVMAANASSGSTGPNAARIALDDELASVLYGKVPRSYGEMPEYLGQYERICPATAAYDRIMKVKSVHLRPRAVRAPLG